MFWSLKIDGVHFTQKLHFKAATTVSNPYQFHLTCLSPKRILKSISHGQMNRCILCLLELTFFAGYIGYLPSLLKGYSKYSYGYIWFIWFYYILSIRNRSYTWWGYTIPKLQSLHTFDFVVWVLLNYFILFYLIVLAAHYSYCSSLSYRNISNWKLF